jgi:pimeloyl-ACP methyl ester carboxylesterase
MNSCVRYAEFLKDSGFNVLAFDFRGHGLSGNSPGHTIRQWATDKEIMDMQAAIAFLKARGHRHLAVLGISRGGVAGMVAAAQDESICAVVMDGAFDTKSTVEYYMHRWVSIFATVRTVYKNLPETAYKVMSYWAIKISELRLRCTFPSLVKTLQGRKFPVFMIHGMDDSYIDVSHANFLYGCASEPKELWLVPGARHNESVIVRGEEYQTRVSDFFEREFSLRKTSMGLRTDTGS